MSSSAPIVASSRAYRQAYYDGGRRNFAAQPAVRPLSFGRLSMLLGEALSQLALKPPIYWPLICCARNPPLEVVPSTLNDYPALRNLLNARLHGQGNTVTFRLSGIEDLLTECPTLGRHIVYANPRHPRNLNQWLKYSKFPALASVTLLPLAPFAISILVYASIFTPGIGLGAAFLKLFLARLLFNALLAMGIAWGADKLINEPIILRPGKQGEKFIQDLHNLTQEVLGLVSNPNLSQAYKAETLKNFAQALAVVFTNFCSSVDDNTALWWRTVLCRSGLYATKHGFNLSELNNLVRSYHQAMQSNPQRSGLYAFFLANGNSNSLDRIVASLHLDLDNLSQTCATSKRATNISQETSNMLNLIQQQTSYLKRILIDLYSCQDPQQALSRLGEYDAIVSSLYENLSLVFPPDLLNSAQSGQLNLAGFSFNPSNFILNASQQAAADLPGMRSQVQALTKVFGAKPKGILGLARRGLDLAIKGEPLSALEPVTNFPIYMETHQFFTIMGQLANIVVPLILLGRNLNSNNYSSYEDLLLGQNGLLPALASLTSPKGVLLSPDPVIGNLGRGTSLFGASLIHYLSPMAYWGHLFTSLIGIVQRKIQNPRGG